jgi:hypothetical protein
MQGLAVMVAAIVVFIVIAQFVGWKTVATLISNCKVQISLTLGRLKLFLSHVNRELNINTHFDEMRREHRGYTLPQG